MLIYIPNSSEQTIGGGWRFIENFKKGVNRLFPDVKFTNKLSRCDAMLIVSASMTEPEEVEEAFNLNKGIVFRCDNIPKKSRNKRARIYDRMRRYGELADVVVFQSEWAREYAGYLVGDETGQVIYNGVDREIFNLKDRDEFSDRKFLFVQYNRDENKRWPEAAYDFHQRWKKNKEVRLTVVGNFSPDLIEADFDFFDDEAVKYIPVLTSAEDMAEVYKIHDYLLFPAFADAAPNTLMEALACGLKPLLLNDVGGTMEIYNRFKEGILPDIDDMTREYIGVLGLITGQYEHEQH